MATTGYQFSLDIYRRADGAPVGQASIAVDWEAAMEWARFVALRHGRFLPADVAGDVAIEPVWHARIGRPYIEGLRMVVATPGGGSAASVLPAAYLRPLARQASAQFIASGALQSGERIIYVASAFPSSEGPVGGRTAVFTAEAATPPLPLPEAALHGFADRAVPAGPSDPVDVPVFIPEAVLDEVAVLARHVDGCETGGILIGHLHRDSSVPDLFVRVTAQLPARHTESSATRLTFTSDTWTDVRAALALRRRDEIMLGWWHSHPVRHWCQDCPPERQRACLFRHGFFSEHDEALHRAVFSKPYGIALVVNDGVGDPTFSLFGWRRGLVEVRGFGVIDGTRPPAAFSGEDIAVEGAVCSQPEPMSPISAALSRN